ncbi:MFS transporter [Sulfobacillus harzensis]|uniref:DHA2 family efflux MFS transporter permease subunit n=1 Tax=Sulfobacillus harzensis TaxID=2729629 RepID=A0A7Y0L3F9_9FIRM|nr:MFS transporter [Sulfobacillus harzensis]NMP22378.1 DHA2 family efflux MFS transporter permease subunit [Sulfobacillus harzensis]
MTPSIQEDPRRWWALGAIAFGLFMALLDVTVVNVALPAIQKGLHESYTSLEWIVNAYALVVAVLLVTSSRLGDIFGRKKIFGVGMGVFTLGSLLCALSPHIHVGSLSGADVLNISRGIQGVGGSAMLPLSLSLITATFHGRERGTAFGIWGGVAGLATALGPLLGGVLVSKVGWPSIFYLNVPTGIIGILLGLWAIHESKDEHHPGSIDLYGLVSLTIALFCLVLALMRGNDKGWGSTYILVLFIAGGVSLVAFVVGELRIRHPMLDPRLFKIPSFTGSAIAAFTVSAGVYALLYYLSIYMQNYLGFSALGAGVRFLPLSALVLIGAPLAGRFTDRIGAKWVLALGMAFMTGGTLFLTRLGHATVAADWTMLLPGLILIGVGNGLVNPPISALAMGTVKPRQIGMASGTSNVARQTGMAFGIAALAAFLANRYNHTVHQSMVALTIPHAPASVKTAIMHGIKAAGPIAGSLGLKSAGPQYTHQAIFPQIAAIARHAFLVSTRDTVWLATLFVAVGLIATVVLVRKQDMMHHQASPPERSTLGMRRQALIVAVTAAWMARRGAAPDATWDEEERLKKALALIKQILEQR